LPASARNPRPLPHQGDAPAELARVALESDAHRGDSAERQGLEVVVAAMHEAGGKQAELRAAQLAALESEALQRRTGVAHLTARTRCRGTPRRRSSWRA